MQPQDVIRRKRDRQVLTPAEIDFFVQGATDGSVSEGQIGAFLMATWLNGMTQPEITALTLSMRDSGRVVDWTGSGLPRERIIDKHSSGGVGDEKITLIVVPLAAACGVIVPNLSGRGLDYCAGEHDMLDAVPGYDTTPAPERFMAAVKDVGGVIIGPTLDLAPADRKLFFVRDVTATVESVALITGSIMSKKLSSAPSGLVICVGSGSGAYMSTTEQARELATAMAEVGAGAGVPSVMLLTDLDCVLGTTVGNAVGVVETVNFLTGKERDPRVTELVLEIVAEMALMAGVVADLEAGRALAQARLEDGSGADRFGRMIAALGGPADFVADPARYLPGAALERPVPSARAGFVAGMDAREIGLALVGLGGGRKRPDEVIDFGVGITHVAAVGAAVGPDAPLCVVKAKDEASWEAAATRIRAAIRVSEAAPAPLPSIIKEKLRRAVSPAGAP